METSRCIEQPPDPRGTPPSAISQLSTDVINRLENLGPFTIARPHRNINFRWNKWLTSFMAINIAKLSAQHKLDIMLHYSGLQEIATWMERIAPPSTPPKSIFERTTRLLTSHCTWLDITANADRLRASSEAENFHQLSDINLLSYFQADNLNDQQSKNNHNINSQSHLVPVPDTRSYQNSDTNHLSEFQAVDINNQDPVNNLHTAERNNPASVCTALSSGPDAPPEHQIPALTQGTALADPPDTDFQELCTNCGDVRHPGSWLTCPAYLHQCLRCRNFHHFERFCFITQPHLRPGQPGSPFNNNKRKDGRRYGSK